MNRDKDEALDARMRSLGCNRDIRIPVHLPKRGPPTQLTQADR